MNACMKTVSPQIIPRSEHPISRALINPNALKILYRLKDNGFTAYLVGGCVRDLLLGREPKDFDVVTDATPGQIKRLFRNCRLVGRRFRLAHLHFADGIIEVATFRATTQDEPEPEEEGPAAGQEEAEPRRQPQQVKSEEGMLLRDNLFGTPEEDAWRRDFTVNALFYNIADFSIVDYVGGLADLRRGVIRTIGEPSQRFTEDPVRMLRAVRFAAMLGFQVEDNAWSAIAGMAETIARAAPPRLYEEVLKLLLLGAGEKTYQLLRQSGLLAPLFPHFSAWLGEETAGFPHTWGSKALAWVDEQIAAGGTVSAPLFMALLFGQYLTEKGERFRGKGSPHQQSIDLALAEFLGETVPVVSIPARVGGQIRDILAVQLRLKKVPGRKPEAVVTRPAFSDALAYLRFSSRVTAKGGETLAWWEQFSEQHRTALPGPKEAPASGGGRPRRRRRRRKGKEGGDGNIS